jgi:uncharacterized protein
MNEQLEDEYYPRIADDILQQKLEEAGAVYIKGTKWCGKSTTAKQKAKSAVLMQDQETKEQNILLAQNSPTLFLSGETPRLIDEWQVVPFIWDHIRFLVDERKKRGQFILTGSATPVDDEAYTHSGIGRIIPMFMRPMTLFESRDGNGEVSLDVLFHHPEEFRSTTCNLKLEDYAYLTCRGGWPEAVKDEHDRALVHARNFYTGLIEDDIDKFLKTKRNKQRVNNVLRSYSRGLASEMSIPKMKEDIAQNEGRSIDEDTVFSYIDVLKRLFIIEELPAWNTNLRSATKIRTSDTHHFVDPSIAAAALEIWPNDLLADLRTFGFFFESLAIRDLRVYSEKLHGSVYHYRDSRGLEADAIIHLWTGEWAAVEVKLSSAESIEEGAKHLLKLRDDIDTAKAKAPSFLMIVTTTPYAYRREDGVYVVPLGCLKD